MGNLYSVSFSSVNATGVAKELFEIIGSTLSSFRVWGLTIGQIAAALSSSAIETLTVTTRVRLKQKERSTLRVTTMDWLRRRG